jgi:hypothetical protein
MYRSLIRPEYNLVDTPIVNWFSGNWRFNSHNCGWEELQSLHVKTELEPDSTDGESQNLVDNTFATV